MGVGSEETKLPTTQETEKIVELDSLQQRIRKLEQEAEEERK